MNEEDMRERLMAIARIRTDQHKLIFAKPKIDLIRINPLHVPRDLNCYSLVSNDRIYESLKQLDRYIMLNPPIDPESFDIVVSEDYDETGNIYTVTYRFYERITK